MLAPSAANTRGTVKPTADSKWVSAKFMSFHIVEKLNDSVARLDVEEAIDTLHIVGLDCIARSPGSFNVEATM